MKAIKRITALALCALMLLGLLSGCGEKKQGDERVDHVADAHVQDEFLVPLLLLPAAGEKA